jgi:hypothetical protein
VYVQKGKGGYFRPAVNSVDYDLAMLTGIIDVFIFGSFRTKPNPENATTETRP